MLRRRLPTTLLLGWGFLAAPAAGQAPGYQQLDNRQILAEYHAEVLEGVNRIMARWGEAWGGDEAEALADLYWDNASLIPPGESPIRGREAIRTWLDGVLPNQGGMEAFMLDFDASGGMALVAGNYRFYEDGIPHQGSLTTVYLRRGRTWRIRAQVFTPSGGR